MLASSVNRPQVHDPEAKIKLAVSEMGHTALTECGLAMRSLTRVAVGEEMGKVLKSTAAKETTILATDELMGRVAAISGELHGQITSSVEVASVIPQIKGQLTQLLRDVYQS